MTAAQKRAKMEQERRARQQIGAIILFALGLLSNKASLAAFAAGVVFLAAVLFVPFLEGLFQVAPFTLEQIGLCAILALLPTVIIQIGKCAGLR